MSKNIKWLYGEIENWVRDGLMGPDQAAAIKGRYPVSESSVAWGKIIFSTLGAILFGLGVILLFAYNWEDMHKFAKLGVIFSSLIAAHMAGLWLQREESNYKPAGEGLSVLGTMLFGAGIWLIAQIYHIDEHFPNAFLAWGLGGLALAWALPSATQGIIACILLTIWHGSEVGAFNNPNHIATPLILISILPLAWRLNSRALLSILIPCVLITLGTTVEKVGDELVFTVIFFCSCGLIAWDSIMRGNKKFPQTEKLISTFGWAPFMVILYFLSFKGTGEALFDHDLGEMPQMIYFLISAAFAYISWFFAIRSDLTDSNHMPGMRWMFLAVLISLVYFTFHSLAGGGSDEWLAAGFYNIMFLSFSVIIIILGCRMSNIGWTTIGCLLFSALVVARYVDLFESLIMRAIAFFIIGGGIFLVGNFYSRIKKEKQEGGAA